MGNEQHLKTSNSDTRGSVHRLRVGIVGATGYAGRELTRIILDHPDAILNQVISRQNQGEVLSRIFPDMAGRSSLKFSRSLVDKDSRVNKSDDLDVLFLCLPHGVSKEYIERNSLMDLKCKIIDLSTDFREEKNNLKFIYGLPELNQHRISTAQHIANPGCFATGIQLGLIPLADAGELRSDIHITALTGSTGAGATLSQTSHFSWRDNNVSVYKSFCHQHLAEIKQSLLKLQPHFSERIYWVPMRGNFTRGIFSSIYFKTDMKEEAAKDIFRSYFSIHPFVEVSASPIDLKLVINTNLCLVHIKKIDDVLHITTVIDNLVKGAAGQAVENMNIMFGLERRNGLNLKPSSF